MHIITQPADAEAITDPALLALVNERIPLLDLAPIVIVKADDTEADIINAIGFSPLVNRVDGIAYPSPEFVPSWDVIEQHQGWTELIYVTADDGSGVIMLIAKGNHDLSQMLKEHQT
ncbi:MAG: hypothetical protein E2598_05560 [Sphingobium sp.]|nr:hypothetical protein [Sphingobium sp.]